MLLRLSPSDNVAVATGRFDAGTEAMLDGVRIYLVDRIDVGHKVALVEIPAGEKVIKFGCPIGSATRLIRAGEPVHTHNLKSDYLPTFTLEDAALQSRDRKGAVDAGPRTPLPDGRGSEGSDTLK